MSTRTYGPRTARPAAPRTNRYPGKCTLCQGWVKADEGVALQDPATRKWTVQHNALECPAPVSPAAAMGLTSATKPALGYYVRNDGTPIKVVESKRMDDDGTPRHYGLVFTPHEGKRPTWEYVKGAGMSVADMVPMTASDAGRLGLSHGHCINCCAPLGGKTLSAAVSALIGYGETCASNNGWAYPTGVGAQRAFLASRKGD